MTVQRTHNSKRDDPTSQRIIDFNEAVIEPLISVRDHCHWLSVIRRSNMAAVMEDFTKALLHMAYDYRGRIQRDSDN